MIMGFRTTQLLHVAAKLGIADLLEAGPRPIAALATMCRCRAQELYRVLRALSNLGIVCELADGRFELTSLGEHLRTHTEGSLRAMATLYGERWIWNAYGSLLHSVRTGEPAFDAVHGKPFFDYLEEDEAAARSFNAAMTSYSAQEISAVTAAYDFTRFRTIADIGGGHGRLLAAMLRASRHARGILFDLPAVCAGVQQTLEQAGVANRARIVSGDFFAEVPPGAQLYVMKSIIHDWDDDAARRILTNCRTAMAADSRLLLIERVIGEPNDADEAKLFDISMLAMLGGRERTAEEYRTLLKSAGLRMIRTLATVSPHSLIEAIDRKGLSRTVELVHDAPPHHEAHALQRGDVVERARRDRDDVRILAGLDAAELVDTVEQRGGIQRRGPDRCGRGHAGFHQQREFLGVLAVVRDAGVGAEGDLDAVLDRRADVLAVAARLPRLWPACSASARPARACASAACGAIIVGTSQAPFFLNSALVCGVGVGAVLDRVDAGFERRVLMPFLPCACAATLRPNMCAVSMMAFISSANICWFEPAGDVAVHAAGRGELDDVGALRDLLAHRAAAIVRAVADVGRMRSRTTSRDVAVGVVRAVAVTAGDRDAASGRVRSSARRRSRR